MILYVENDYFTFYMHQMEGVNGNRFLSNEKYSPFCESKCLRELNVLI